MCAFSAEKEEGCRENYRGRGFCLFTENTARRHLFGPLGRLMCNPACRHGCSNTVHVNTHSRYTVYVLGVLPGAVAPCLAHSRRFMGTAPKAGQIFLGVVKQTLGHTKEHDRWLCNRACDEARNTRCYKPVVCCASGSNGWKNGRQSLCQQVRQRAPGFSPSARTC